MMKKIYLGKSNDYTLHVKSILERMGFEVIMFNTMPELKDKAKNALPDMIMLYARLSSAEDADFLKHIKENTYTSATPIVIISADRADVTEMECKALGCSAYLLKPVSIKGLHRVLEDFIYTPHGHKRNNIRAMYVGIVFVSHGGKTYELSPETLSEGGIYLNTEDPLPVGTEVSITIPMDMMNKISLQGKVIYTYTNSSKEMEFPPGMAIEFADKDEDKLLVVSDFVKGLLTIPYYDPNALRSNLM
jgi:CheY-like chemotaxis protein